MDKIKNLKKFIAVLKEKFSEETANYIEKNSNCRKFFLFHNYEVEAIDINRILLTTLIDEAEINKNGLFNYFKVNVTDTMSKILNEIMEEKKEKIERKMCENFLIYNELIIKNFDIDFEIDEKYFRNYLEKILEIRKFLIEKILKEVEKKFPKKIEEEFNKKNEEKISFSGYQ